VKVISPEFVKDKIVFLRLDIDVPIGESDKSDKSEDQSVGGSNGLVVLDDFRLKAGLPTLNMCLENAQKVIIMGHIGRPEGKKVPELSVAPILDWLEQNIDHCFLDEEKLFLLENLRFESGEEEASVDFAKEIISMVSPTGSENCVFVNEAFASYHQAASITILPTLLPSAAGLKFAQEVKKLTQIRETPLHPLLFIMGGAKVEDKMPVVQEMAKIADAVLVGGKIAGELRISEEQNIRISERKTTSDSDSSDLPVFRSSGIPHNVFVGTLNKTGEDMTSETIASWENLVKGARMIVWNGPIGKIEESGSAEGTYKLAQMIADSSAQVIVGGGDTVGFLGQVDLLDKFENIGFVSTGGGAMLKFLETGTLPSIEALK